MVYSQLSANTVVRPDDYKSDKDGTGYFVSFRWRIYLTHMGPNGTGFLGLPPCANNAFRSDIASILERFDWMTRILQFFEGADENDKYWSMLVAPQQI